MADPSGNKPLFPQKGSGSGSGSGSEGKSRERTVIPGSGDHGDGAPSPPPAPPVAHPPVVPARHSGAGRPTKKKAKMGKEAVAAMKVAVVEEPGKKKRFASLENLPGRARTCSICRREFPTARALFGHMRSHPERLWRGAHPPPVSPRLEEESLDVEQTRQAQELTRSLLNIGQRILSTEKYKSKEGFQAAGGIGVSSSSGALFTAHGASGVISVRSSGSSSRDSGKKKKKKKRMKKKKKTTGKALDYTDEDQRKQIHSQIDLNKEAPAEYEDEEVEETPGASSD